MELSVMADAMRRRGRAAVDDAQGARRERDGHRTGANALQTV